MVKPQFEVGRERVGKGGVVRRAEDRRRALIDVALAARARGAAVLGFASSGLPGPKGNLETFVWLAEGERSADATSGAFPASAGGRPATATDDVDIERLAREVEP
jgi:23S rRNA (cytidine1920-2'-O)/16S rRNA (cytidine1409-2'-O)-methyltransferase